jgi:hypothetical protein
MAYDINKSDGSLLVTVQDGSIESSASSIKLVGKNYSGYGEFIAEDLIHMLEHFAETTAPTSPITGQLWFNTAKNKINVYDSVGNWKEIGHVVATATEPNASTRVTGDLWWDTATNVLYVWNGTAHVPVGIGSGTTAVRIVQIEDTGGTTHTVIVEQHNNRFIKITSGDSFTPASSELQPDNTTIVSEFPTIGKGINMTNRTDFKFRGTATVAEYADVAERYQIKEEGSAGDVVMIDFDGDAEIRVADQHATPYVFGVISTAPALEMNASAGIDVTHPYIALAGRVPCKVIGPIAKGQKLIVAGVHPKTQVAIPGVAKAVPWDGDKADSRFAVALEAYADEDNVGTIEVVVRGR